MPDVQHDPRPAVLLETPAQSTLCALWETDLFTIRDVLALPTSAQPAVTREAPASYLCDWLGADWRASGSCVTEWYTTWCSLDRVEWTVWIGCEA